MRLFDLFFFFSFDYYFIKTIIYLFIIFFLQVRSLRSFKIFLVLS